MKPKISVIVPVYNVQNYLRECLEHLINQTYRNIEIILVDDGSTDQSGNICDEYQEMDNRIHVIHKTNGGLSDARNTGIEYASGDYIGFIDSDDYPDLDMYETLYGMIEKYKAAIAICGCYRSKKNKVLDRSDTLLTKEAVYYEMAGGGRIESHAVDKLYSRELFCGVRYPVGKTYEDIYTTYKVIDKVKEAAYTPAQLYYYRDNEFSITNQSFKESDMNLVYASIQFKQFLQKEYPDIASLQQDAVTRNEIALVRKIFEAGYIGKDIEDFLLEDIHKHIFHYMFSQYKLSSKCFGAALTVNYKVVKRIWSILKR